MKFLLDRLRSKRSTQDDSSTDNASVLDSPAATHVRDHLVQHSPPQYMGLR